MTNNDDDNDSNKKRKTMLYGPKTAGHTVAARQITLALIEVGRGAASQSRDNVA